LETIFQSFSYYEKQNPPYQYTLSGLSFELLQGESLADFYYIFTDRNTGQQDTISSISYETKKIELECDNCEKDIIVCDKITITNFKVNQVEQDEAEVIL
jgi:hypothetical protein